MKWNSCRDLPGGWGNQKSSARCEELHSLQKILTMPPSALISQPLLLSRYDSRTRLPLFQCEDALPWHISICFISFHKEEEHFTLKAWRPFPFCNRYLAFSPPPRKSNFPCDFYFRFYLFVNVQEKTTWVTDVRRSLAPKPKVTQETQTNVQAGEYSTGDWHVILSPSHSLCFGMGHYEETHSFQRYSWFLESKIQDLKPKIHKASHR